MTAQELEKTESSTAEKEVVTSSKQEKDRQQSDVTSARATAKYVRLSPRKARAVAAQIRMLPLPEATRVLTLLPQKAARKWLTVLQSAQANAENNYGLNPDHLIVKHITADEGPTLKRFRPRARGSASPILKRTTHLSITLERK